MSRAQRILRCVAERPFPCVFENVFDAVRASEQDRDTATGRLRAAVSAQLKQLVDAGKLRRTGTPGAYLYHKTRTTLVDLRSHDEEGNPRQPRRRRAKPKAAPKPAKAAPVARAVPRKTAGTRPVTQGFRIKPEVPPAAAPARSKHAERETVEQFLARGGRIQHLANGEVSHPLKHIGAAAPKPTRAKKPTT